MTIALIFGGDTGNKLKTRLLSVRDGIDIDVYNSVSDFIMASTAREQFYGRTFIDKKLLDNTEKLLDYRKKYCKQAEFVLVGKKGANSEEEMKKFSLDMGSSQCIGILIQGFTAIECKAFVSNDIAELQAKFGVSVESDITFETAGYEKPEPKVVPPPQAETLPKKAEKQPKKSRFNFFGFGKKKAKEEPEVVVVEEEEEPFEAVFEEDIEDILIPPTSKKEVPETAENEEISEETEDTEEEIEDNEENIDLGDLSAFSAEEDNENSDKSEISEDLVDLNIGDLERSYREQEQTTNAKVIEKVVEKVIVKEVVKEIPVQGKGKVPVEKKKPVFSGITKILILTGDRGAGVTTLAWEMANEAAKYGTVLYFDADVDNHGLLNYLQLNRFYEYSELMQQGIKFCKTEAAFKNCVMPYDVNLDILSTRFGCEISDEELDTCQSVVLDMHTNYDCVIVDAVGLKLHLLGDLLTVATPVLVVEKTRRGFMNISALLDRTQLLAKQKRKITGTGTLVLTKGDSKSDVNKLKKFVYDMIEFDADSPDWLKMRTIERCKVDEAFLRNII